MFPNKYFKRIGVVGSGKYKNKQMVIQKLNQLVEKNGDIIVSGHSPRNNEDNVDIWAEDWANDNCRLDPLIFPPKTFTEDGFFARNELIAHNSDFLFVFINLGQMKSGAWNTVKYFTKKDVTYEQQWIVFDEQGKPWHTNDLPKWIKL